MTMKTNQKRRPPLTKEQQREYIREYMREYRRQVPQKDYGRRMFLTIPVTPSDHIEDLLGRPVQIRSGKFVNGKITHVEYLGDSTGPMTVTLTIEHVRAE